MKAKLHSQIMKSNALVAIAAIVFAVIVFSYARAEKERNRSIVSSYVRTIEYVVAAQETIASNIPKKDERCRALLDKARAESVLYFVENNITDYDAQFIVVLLSKKLLDSNELSEQQRKKLLAYVDRCSS